jgi:ribosome biogenesis GTPase A
MDADLDRAVQWYPGHMVRAMRNIGERIKLADVIVEVVDARVPHSGRNPMLDSLIGRRGHVLVLNREDLASPDATAAWIARYAAAGLPAVATDGRAQPSVKRAYAAIEGLARGVRNARAIVVGLPNSGKSSIINGLLRRAAAKTEDRAGVTRRLQWFRMANDVELMDTPGIMVPKISNATAQWKLALVGAVPRSRYDPEEVVNRFYRWQQERGAPAGAPDLDEFARARGFARRGGIVDLHNAAQSYIRAFNDGAFGRITLEMP